MFIVPDPQSIARSPELLIQTLPESRRTDNLNIDKPRSR